MLSEGFTTRSEMSKNDGGDGAYRLSLSLVM